LSIEPSGKDVIIKVRDNGLGMTPAELSAVFELFAQAGRADHAVQGGLGVGLSLAKSLAELHGGSLTARSEGLDQGSEFTLRLPVTMIATETNATASRVEAGEPQIETRRRVLIVDDNVDAAESLGMLLAQNGHEVRTAHGGVQAVSLAKSFRPEIMILDLGMPEMDGYAVARAIREDPMLAHTRLIALSGYGQPEDRRRTTAAGFEAHLIKPVDPDKVNALLLADGPMTRSREAALADALLRTYSSEHSEAS
jgi:CheY-like chemotaxis protein